MNLFGIGEHPQLLRQGLQHRGWIGAGSRDSCLQRRRGLAWHVQGPCLAEETEQACVIACSTGTAVRWLSQPWLGTEIERCDSAASDLTHRGEREGHRPDQASLLTTH